MHWYDIALPLVLKTSSVRSIAWWTWAKRVACTVQINVSVDWDSHTNILWVSLCHLGSFAPQHWVVASWEGRKKGQVVCVAKARDSEPQNPRTSPGSLLPFLCGERKVQLCLPHILFSCQMAIMWRAQWGGSRAWFVPQNMLDIFEICKIL